MGEAEQVARDYWGGALVGSRLERTSITAADTLTRLRALLHRP